MLDFITLKVKKTRNGPTVLTPVFDTTSASEDLLAKGRCLYGIWDENKNCWITRWERAAALVDKNISILEKKYIAAHPGEEVITEYLRDDTTKAADRLLNYISKTSDTPISFNSKMTFIDQEFKKEDYCTVKAKYAVNDGPRDNYEKLISTLYSPAERHKIEWLIGAVIAGKNLEVQKFGVFYGPPGSGKSTILEVIYKLFDGYYTTFSSKDIARSDTFALSAFKNNPLVAVDAEGDLSKIESNSTLNTITAHDVVQINEKYRAKFDLRPIPILFICTNNPVKITDSKSGLLRRLIDINPSGDLLPIKEYREIMKAIPFELGSIAYHCRQVYLDDPDYYNGYRPTEMFEETNDFYDFMLMYYDAFAGEDYTLLKTAWTRYKEYADECGYLYKMNMRVFKHELKNYFKSFSVQGTVMLPDGSPMHASSIYRGFRKDYFKNSSDTVGNSVKTVTKAQPIPNVELPDDIYKGIPKWLQLKDYESYSDNPLHMLLYEAHAQYATTDANEVPKRAWKNKNGDWNVSTRLCALIPSNVHYVLTQDVEPSLIVIDFDKKGEDGTKSLRENLIAAKTFPKTYAEVSKGGQGLHLHYIYDGDVNDLSRLYDDNIEVKVFTGKSALRRRLSLCNDEEIAHISSGLPLRGDKGRKEVMIDWKTVKNEKAIRTIILRNLAKEYHADTTSSIHFIKKTLDDAYTSGTDYDVRDLRNAVMNFAQNATNQSEHCMQQVMAMEFCSDKYKKDSGIDISDGKANGDDVKNQAIVKISDVMDAKYAEVMELTMDKNKPIIFLDVEVFKNLFVVCYKKQGDGGKESCVKLINPTPNDISRLVSMNRIIGFNNLGYDNYMLYARILGYTNYQLYELSQRIIEKGSKDVGMRTAKKLSYSDVYDFSNTKQSLKKWEIELHIHHQELGLRWDEEAPEELWETIADYCCNDVVATEKVFDHLKGDWSARQILASISGLTVNDPTNSHSARIIFGDNKAPQGEFNYVDLSKEFPGYEFSAIGIDKNRYPKDEKGNPIFKKGKSIYLGEDPSEGGYVYAEPGIYYNVALLDIQSLHPSTIENIQAFGPRYTAKFSELKKTRVLVKHKKWEEARSMLGGALVPFLTGIEGLSEDQQQSIADDLSYALKIVINSVYGLTSANFPNQFKDPRNVDNIVAKRGALFMMTLRHAVQDLGYTVCHIKTDSIKIPDADERIIQFVTEFGKKYGYIFEYEANYERICLVNDAVYIARYDSEGERTKNGKHANCWTATGTQFAVPYVYKTLFTHEAIEFDDMCETKSVSGSASIYLDLDEKVHSDRVELEREIEMLKKHNMSDGLTATGKVKKVFDPDKLDHEVRSEYEALKNRIDKLHNLTFIGKVGQFCPIKNGCGGGILLREADGEYTSVTGSKGYRWLESEIVKNNGKEADIDKEYYRELVDKAYQEISKYGDADEFLTV